MDEYQIISHIGKGATSQVFLAENTQGKKAIVKTVNNIQDAEQEAAILRMLPKHKHLIQLLEKHSNNLIFEYHAGQRLGPFKRGNSYNTTTAIQITIKILQALKVIHHHDILHCDITPHNIIIAGNDPESIKIIDFGSAVQKNSSGEYIGPHNGATRWYRPPELKKINNTFTAKLNDSSDVYSAACVCLYLLNGEAPFRKRVACRKIQNIELRRILRKATHKDRKRRYQTAQELLDELIPFTMSEEKWNFQSIIVTSGSPVEIAANPTSYPLIGKGLQGAVFKLTDNKCVKIYAKRRYCSREATVLTNIGHSRFVPQVYEIGSNYIVMEYLPGTSLEQTLKASGKLSPLIAENIVNLLKEQEKLNFTRIDFSLRHCIFDHEGNLKMIDHVNSFRITRKRPIRLLKDLKQLGLCQDFLDYVKQHEPALLMNWT